MRSSRGRGDHAFNLSMWSWGWDIQEGLRLLGICHELGLAVQTWIQLHIGDKCEGQKPKARPLGDLTMR